MNRPLVLALTLRRPPPKAADHPGEALASGTTIAYPELRLFRIVL